MTTSLVELLGVGFTGCMATTIGAVFRLHTRFIRLEESVKYIGKDVNSVKRLIVQRLPKIRIANDWSDEERENGDDKW